MLKNITFLIVFVLSIATVCAQNNKDTMQIAHYYGLGCPNINRFWLPDDYVKAIDILEMLSKVSTNKLPRINSTGTKKLFKKLTSIKQYKLLMDTIFDKNTRVNHTFTLMGQTTRLIKLYPSIVNQNKLEYASEHIAFSLTLTYLVEEALKIVDDIKNNTPNLNETQQDGLKKVEYGLNTFVAGVLLTLEKEYIYYDKNEIEEYAAFFLRFYTKNKRFFKKDATNEYDNRIKDMAKTHEYKSIRTLIKKMY